MTTLAQIAVAHWSLADTSDDKGTNTLTNNNSVTFTTGKVGNGASFTAASSQYLSRASNSDLQCNNEHMTICCWVKLTSLPANNNSYSIVAKDVDSPANSRDYTLDYVRLDGTPSSGGFRFYINGGGSAIAVSGTTGFNSTGVWYFVCASHNPDTDLVTISVNAGTPSTSGTSGVSPNVSSAEFRIGARSYSGFEDYMNGMIDNVAVFKGRALTTGEVNWIWNGSRGRTYTEIAAYNPTAFAELAYLPARSASNPIIAHGAHAEYDSQVFDCCVIPNPNNSNQLLMYASLMAAPTETGEMSIGLFTASVSNPASWTYVGQVLTGADTPTYTQVRLGSVIYNSDTSEIWIYYTGYVAAPAAADGEVSLAKAPSATPSVFTDYASNPILTGTGNGVNDGVVVGEPAVVREGNNWSMVYDYRATSSGAIAGYRAAISSDGQSWTKLGTGNLMGNKPDGTLFVGQEFHQILKVNDKWYCIFESGSSTVNYALFAAVGTSPTGPFSSIDYPLPLIGPSGDPAAFDYKHLATPFIASIHGYERIFYCGTTTTTPYTGQWSAGMANYPNAAGTNILTEPFTAANNTALSAISWPATTGTFKVTSNKAVPNSNANDDMSLRDFGAADYVLTCSVTIRGSGANASNPCIVVRATDSTHLWLVAPQYENTSLSLFVNTGSGYGSARQTIAFSWVDNTTYTIKVACFGSCITVYVNDVEKLIETGAIENYNATKGGIRLGKASSPAADASWDDFVVDGLPSFTEPASGGGRTGMDHRRLRPY